MHRDLRPAVLAPLLLAGAAAALPHHAPHTAAPELAPPTVRVGPFTLQQLLGTGAMGAVYLAEQDAPLRRQVALKVVPYDERDRSAERYRTERDALASVSHRNIAHLLDAGIDGDLGWLALEPVPGEPITAYSDRLGLSLEQRLTLFTDVCAAVEHLHARGFVHRDLKPDNILVTERNGTAEVKLVDLGFALAMRGPASAPDAETIVGTLAYMAPEQLHRPASVDRRADVFALGAVLYELVSGRAPFAREDDIASLRLRHAAAPPPSTVVDANAAAARGTTPRRLRRRLAGRLDALVGVALAIDPAQRPDSASALAGALGRGGNARWWHHAIGRIGRWLGA
jgi:serine/threonine protein kinase